MKHTIQHEAIYYTGPLCFYYNSLTLYDKSSIKNDNLRFLRPLDTISDRSVRYDYNAAGYLSDPVYVDFCQWRNLNVMKLKSMMNS